MRNDAGLIYLCGLMLVARTSLAQQAKAVKVPEGLVGNPALEKRVKVTCPGLAVGELHVPKVGDLLRARELTARQILGLNGLNTGNGFSYSEFETVGAPELAEFLNRELVNHPAVGQPPIVDPSKRRTSPRTRRRWRPTIRLFPS